MAFDIQAVFSRGGEELVNLLDYCVRSVQVDPVFVFLVGEYRMHPTTPKAVALYDVFCAPQAPARLSAPGDLLPPQSLRIEIAVRPLRLNLDHVRSLESGAPPLILPPHFLFDAVAQQIQETSAAFRHIKRRYKPQRTPLENLPGGRMNAGQRHFVEQVWEPSLRPLLVAAGFRRVSSPSPDAAHTPSRDRVLHAMPMAPACGLARTRTPHHVPIGAWRSRAPAGNGRNLRGPIGRSPALVA